jgi:hypothetical protein
MASVFRNYAKISSLRIHNKNIFKVFWVFFPAAVLVLVSCVHFGYLATNIAQDHQLKLRPFHTHKTEFNAHKGSNSNTDETMRIDLTSNQKGNTSLRNNPKTRNESTISAATSTLSQTKTYLYTINTSKSNAKTENKLVEEMLNTNVYAKNLTSFINLLAPDKQKQFDSIHGKSSEYVHVPKIVKHQFYLMEYLQSERYSSFRIILLFTNQ